MKKDPLILRIELLHLSRSVWREVLVPNDASLADLHEIILMVMPWEGDHLHGFLDNRNNRWTPIVPFDLEPEEQEEAEDVIFVRALFKKKESSFRYVYDFGDDWTHEITLLGYHEAGENVDAPRCLAGEGAAPLDDCGGPPGDEAVCKFVAARKAGRQKKRDPLNEWVPEEYDPAYFSVDDANERLGSLDLYWDPDLEIIDRLLSSIEDDSDDEPDEDPIPESYQNLAPAQIEEFRKLLEVAHALLDAKPWAALSDFQLIGWEDPDDRKIRLISVLGAAEEVYALHVHLPDRGYRFWKHVHESGAEPDPETYLSLLNMYEVDFVDPMELEAGDQALYDAVGMRVPEEDMPGAVRFRFYHPHKRPYFLPPALAPEFLRILTHFLSFTQETLAKPRHRKALMKRLPEPQGLPETIPTLHLPPGAKDEEGAWQLVDKPVPWERADLPFEDYDPPVAEIFRLAALPESEEVWEIGSCLMRHPIFTDDGPVIAILALIGRMADGSIYPPHLESDWTKPYGQIVWEAFCAAADNLGFRPKELHVATDIAERTFTRAAEHGTFTLRRNPGWTVVNEPLLQITTMPPP